MRIQSDARRVTTPHFLLLVAPQVGTATSARLGLVVTTKVGPAVDRNRVKRVCRACFRTWSGFLPDGIDLVVIARPGAQALGLAGVRREWEGAHGLLQKRAREALAKRTDEAHLSAAKSPKNDAV